MAKKWHQTKIFRIGAGVVGFIVLVLLLVPFLFSIDDFIPQITAAIEEQTGRKAEIEKLRLHILPSVSVQMVNFHIKNPDGFPEGDTLLVKSVTVGTELMPLLDGKILVNYITINGVEVNLLTNQYGRINYDFTPPRTKRKKKAAPEGEKPAFSLERIDSISVRNVVLTSGSYHTRRKKISPAFTLTGLNTKVNNIHPGDPDFLKKLTLEVDMKGMELTAPTLVKPARVTEGALTAKEGAGSGSFTAALDTIRVNGDIRIADLRNPRADFNLTIPELDLLKLASLTRSVEAGPPSSSRKGSSTTSRRLLARGSVKIHKLILSPLTASSFTSKVRIYAHKIDVNPFTLKFYSGTLEGTANLNHSSADQPLSVNAKIRGVNVARLVKAVAPDATRKITGTFEADAKLNTSLAGDPAESLSGQGTFTVRNGTLPGLDLTGKLVTLAKFFQMSVPKSDTTKFTYFGGDFRIQQQRVHSRSLKLESDSLKGTASGSFGLDGTLDYKGTGTVTGEGEVPEEEKKKSNPFGKLGRAIGKVLQKTINAMHVVRVPFAVKGTFEDPQFFLSGKPQKLKTVETAKKKSQ